MKRWFADTLHKRLFLLIWATLVVSHFAAFTITGFVERGNASFMDHVPTLPSLPPVPGLEDGGGPPRREGNQLRERGFGPPHDGGPGRAGHAPGPDHEGGGAPFEHERLSTRGFILDYGIRLLLIGFASWLGARWLSRPMSKLVVASHALGSSLDGSDVEVRLDENDGTVEVRETAKIFNLLAHRLRQYLSTRSLMVAAISHDLRTPMTRIRMRLEQTPGDPLAAKSIADINEMDDLIDSALVVFRGHDMAEPSQRTNVLALVQSLTDNMADLGQPVKFSSDVDKAVAEVQPVALQRALSNLMTNAVRHGERAEVLLMIDKKSIVIYIDDFGPGIPPSQLEAVKQPFFRLDPSRRRSTGGAGLGLYIAQDLLSQQGGTLELTNRATGGLRAAVTLPL